VSIAFASLQTTRSRPAATIQSFYSFATSSNTYVSIINCQSPGLKHLQEPSHRNPWERYRGLTALQPGIDCSGSSGWRSRPTLDVRCNSRTRPSFGRRLTLSSARNFAPSPVSLGIPVTPPCTAPLYAQRVLYKLATTSVCRASYAPASFSPRHPSVYQNPS